MLTTNIYPAFQAWQLPLTFPGRARPVAVWLLADEPDPEIVIYDRAGMRRLAVAVLAQALRDAASAGNLRALEREDARRWLIEEGATWAKLLGRRIYQADLEAWAAAGYPPGDNRAHNGRSPKSADSHQVATRKKGGD